MEFLSYRSYLDFAWSVRRKWRYAFDDEQVAFLETLMATSKDRYEVVPEGAYLWRAQLGHTWEHQDLGDGHIESLPFPFPPARMKPLPDRAHEGRANPKGIPYLYLATEKKTAIAEIRPWIGSRVSVARLKIKKRLRLVNCTGDSDSGFFYLREPDPAERERSVWRDVDEAFAEPVDRSDDTADYVPTQIIAEQFRKHGLDGVAYRSSLGSGHNIALFDPEVAEVVTCSLVELRSVTFDYGQVANPYFVR